MVDVNRPDPPITLAELCSERGLALRLLAGGPAGDAGITGVDFIELFDDLGSVAAGDVVLTTGMGLGDDPEVQKRIVGSLVGRGAAGLGLVGGAGGRGPSAALLRAADQEHFPVFEVPAGVTPRAVAAFVSERVSDRVAQELRARLSMQDELLESLLEQEGFDRLIATVADLLRATVILFDGSGRVVSEARAGHPLNDDERHFIWAAYEPGPGHPTGETEAERVVGGLRVVVRDVWFQGQVELVLAVAYPVTEAIPEAALSAASYAQRLLSLGVLKSREARLLWKRVRASVLRDMIMEAGGRESMRARALQYGVDPEAEYLFFVAGDAAPGERAVRKKISAGSRLDEAQDELEDHVGMFFSVQKASALTMLRAEAVVAMVQMPRAEATAVGRTAEALWGWLTERHPAMDFVVSVSDFGQGVGAVRRTYGQAIETFLVARGEPGGGRVRLFADLGPAALFLLSLSPAPLRALAGSGVAGLEQHDTDKHDRLVETLEAYISADRNVQRAAQRLWIHPNTLRYRLKKIEDILGVPLDSTRLLADLYLCFRARAILRSQDLGEAEPAHLVVTPEMPRASSD